MPDDLIQQRYRSPVFEQQLARQAIGHTTDQHNLPSHLIGQYLSRQTLQGPFRLPAPRLLELMPPATPTIVFQQRPIGSQDGGMSSPPLIEQAIPFDFMKALPEAYPPALIPCIHPRQASLRQGLTGSGCS